MMRMTMFKKQNPPIIVSKLNQSVLRSGVQVKDLLQYLTFEQ